MPALFKLDVETDHPARRAVLRLRAPHDTFVAAHEVELPKHPPATWEGLFDTRNHVRRMRGVTPESRPLVALGQFLGEHVLGLQIAKALANGIDSRTLLVRLPGDPADLLAAAFARAGLGKTSLAAEAMHLWFGEFDYVLAFQAKRAALTLEELYRRLDQKLAKASTAYRERCHENEMASVYVAASERFKGGEREEALRDNLIDALTHERLLLVLDNFETNLLTKPRADGAYACADPAWERLFEALAERLRGTGSRVLITSRHKLAALDKKALWVPLGPLPIAEAALFFQNHAPLRELWYGDDAAKELAEVRGWWARQEKGEHVPEAPNGEYLVRALVGGLNTARAANLALERWQAGLDLLGETEKVQRALGSSVHELARTRFNTYWPLLRLGKLADAKTVLEGCLDVFRLAEDVTMEAMTLTALADVWDNLGDPRQAATLQRRALALFERLPDPGSRAISHANLANYLYATDAPAEAGSHRLAALAYYLATGLDPRNSLRNLAFSIREAAARNARYDLPRLADVLAAPAFAPLRAFLADRGIAPADLQAAIDARVEEVCAAVAAEPPKPA